MLFAAFSPKIALRPSGLGLSARPQTLSLQRKFAAVRPQENRSTDSFPRPWPLTLPRTNYTRTPGLGMIVADKPTANTAENCMGLRTKSIGIAMGNPSCSRLLAVVLTLLPPSLLLAGETHPAATGTLAGTLVDGHTALPVVGAKLSLVEPGEFFAETDSSGRFVFRNIPPATYSYMFAYVPGQKEPQASLLVRKQVEVLPDTTTSIAVQRMLLPGRPPREAPRVKALEFSDNTKRRYSKPIIVREPLGMAWPRQYLTRFITFEPSQCRRPSLRLIDGASGRETPFQLTDVKYGREDFIRSCAITFAVSLNPFESKVYAVCSDWQEGFQAPNYDMGLAVETDDTTGERVLSNSLIAVRLPPAASKEPQPAPSSPAPILALRGPDGVWLGSGRFAGKCTITSFTCTETATGPIFREFEIVYKFATEKDRGPAPEYRVRIRLYADTNYVLFAEEMSGQVDLTFELAINPNLDPDSVTFAKEGVAAFEKLSNLLKRDTQTLAVFRPWNPPNLRKSHNWFGIMSGGNRKDAVGVVQVNASNWALPRDYGWENGAWVVRSDDRHEVQLVGTAEGKLTLQFPHRLGSRQFALAVFDKTKNWDAASISARPVPEGKSHYLNRLHIQLSQIDVGRLMALRLDRAKLTEEPRLLFNTRTFGQLKQSFEKAPERFPVLLRDVFTGSRVNSFLVRSHILDGISFLRQAVLGPWDEKEISGFAGAAMHSATLEEVVRHTVLLYDANVSSGLFSQIEKEVILNTLALVAAQLENPNYRWAVAHDPELSARRDGAITAISLLIDRHPDSSRRILEARAEMEKHLALIAAASGVPPDTTASARALCVWAELAPLIENALEPTKVGASPFATPNFVRALAHLAMLTAPPDPRFNGLRLLPPLGRSGAGDAESLAALGIAASRLAQSSPLDASRFMWAWEQAGRPVFERMRRHKPLYEVLKILPPAIEPTPPPKLTSVVLPNFGSLLRANYLERDEAYLFFKCSPLPISFHNDQGSILWHAFGRPLIVDSGFPPERHATWAHNTVRVDSRAHNAPGRIIGFFPQQDDDYVVGQIEINALSSLQEYTKAELDAMAAAMPEAFVPPHGHRADGSRTADLLGPYEKIDPPVVIQRHLLFNRQRQYLVILDRITGSFSTDVFFNVCADAVRLEGTTAHFVGPYGVDLYVHAFGSGNIRASVHEDMPQRFTLRLSQPAPANEEKSSPPVVEYLTVLCPVRRQTPGETSVRQFGAPEVSSLDGILGVRIAYGDIVRYVFFSREKAEYERANIRFSGTRGMITLRKTHFDAALLAPGEFQYQGLGARIDSGMARFRIAPGGFIEGEVSSRDDHKITFFGLAKPPSSLRFQTDGLTYIAEGDEKVITYGVRSGFHTITICPK